MPERETVTLPATGITLPDARTDEQYSLGEFSGVWVLSAIRHRH
jgi:hypothetical protein